MELVKDWIGGICAVAIIVSVIKAIAPQNSAGRCVQLVGALVLVMAVISPFKSLSVSDIMKNDRRYELEFDRQNNRLQEENEKIQKEIIETEVSSYISQRLIDFGLKCKEVEVAAVKRQDGYLYPESIRILMDEKISETKRKEIEKTVKRECGIPEDKVVFEQKGGL